MRSFSSEVGSHSLTEGLPEPVDSQEVLRWITFDCSGLDEQHNAYWKNSQFPAMPESLRESDSLSSSRSRSADQRRCLRSWSCLISLLCITESLLLIDHAFLSLTVRVFSTSVWIANNPSKLPQSLQPLRPSGGVFESHILIASSRRVSMRE